MSRLPEGWSEPELFQDEIAIEGVLVARAGMAAVAPTGEEVTGSAAAIAGASPEGALPLADRALFELLERASIVEALGRAAPEWPVRDASREVVRKASRDEVFPESVEPDRWRYARSNGIAVHRSWNAACRNALLELAERDRVLAAWYGETSPVRIASSVTNRLVAGSQLYDWHTYAFPTSDSVVTAGVEVVGTFGFPRAPGQLPLAVGFGAAGKREEAVERATCEAVQLLAFLWGEPIDESPRPGAPTALLHLEHHQTARGQTALRHWLESSHPVGARPARADVVAYVDLTPPWLGDLVVVKAYSETARPLTFGDSPYVRHLPSERRIHPVP